MKILPSSNRPKTNIGFKSQVTPSMELFKKNGFVFQNRVNLVAPDGKPCKGFGFIQDLKGYGIGTLITDDKLYELGNAHAEIHSDGIGWLIIKNLTTPQPEMPLDFMSPIFRDFAKKAKNGYFKHVATEAYNTLINYIRKNYPEVKELRADAKSQQSWNFHHKYGFSDNQFGEYNSYAFTNELFYRL